MLRRRTLRSNHLEFNCEALEERRLLTGYLQLHGTSGNDLIINGSEGDELANISLTSDRLEISVFNQWVFTRDNGFDEANIRDIRIDLGGGNDRLEISFSETEEQLSPIRDIRIDQRGEGVDSVNELEISGLQLRDIRIEGGAGELDIDLEALQGRDVRFTNRTEVTFDYARLSLDDLELRDFRMDAVGDSNSNIDLSNIEARRVQMNFRDGDAIADFSDSTISGNVSLRGGSGTFENQHHARFYQTTMDRLDFRGGEATERLSLRKSTVMGNLNFNGGAGNDGVILRQATVLGNAAFRMGNGDDEITHRGNSSDGATEFQGNVIVDLGNGNNRFLVNEEPKGLSIDGRLTVNGGNDDDYVVIAFADTATIVGSMRVNLRGGNDEAAMVSVQASADVWWNLGNGDDEVGFFGGEQASVISGDLNVNLGNGDNFLDFDYFEESQSFQVLGRFTVSAGNGNDEFNMIVDADEPIDVTEMRVNLGNGDDLLDLEFLQIVGRSRFDLGNGTDEVRIENVLFSDLNSPAEIRLGNDNDFIEILPSNDNANQMNIRLLLGNGDDEVAFHVTEIGAPTFISGERGRDTLRVSSPFTTFDEDRVLGIEDVIISL